MSVTRAEPPLTAEQANLLRGFGFTDEQAAEVWGHCRDSLPGVLRCAARARGQGRQRGNTGAGLLLAMLRGGEHLLGESDPRPLTGWRWTRGTHGETWIRDEMGRDRPPNGYVSG